LQDGRQRRSADGIQKAAALFASALSRSTLEATQPRLGAEPIRTTLDEGLPDGYTKELYEQKCQAVFLHVFESYEERSNSVYSGLS